MQMELLQKKYGVDYFRKPLTSVKINNIALFKQQISQNCPKINKLCLKRPIKEENQNNHSTKCNCKHQTKISQMFFIKSINLLTKPKLQKENQQAEKKSFPKSIINNPSRYQIKQIESNSILRNKSLMHPQAKLSLNSKQKNKLPNIIMTQTNIPFLSKVQNKEKETILKFYQNVHNTKDLIFQSKYTKLIEELQKVSQIHGIQFNRSQYKIPLKYWCGKGNNSKLIKQTMKKRWWWALTEDKNSSEISLIWSQLKDKQYYSPMMRRSLSKTSESQLTESSQVHSSISKRRKSQRAPSAGQGLNLPKASNVFKVDRQWITLHNHYEHNEFLGNKKALFYNMKQYYENLGEDVFKYLPLTFHVASKNDIQFSSFVTIYNQELEKNKRKKLWIVKPGENSNRGRGITIHSQLSEIIDLVQHLQDEQPIHKTFIIQEYIEKPFLYNKRKFDIRCYIMLSSFNNSLKGYWYREGYIRTSCYQFTLDSFANSFVHLTNDAIQKHCEEYGKYEDGNKLSFQLFKRYLANKWNKKYDFDAQIYPKIRKIAIDSIRASYQMLCGKVKKPVFEIFGLDFMIDQNFEPWLIEVNTNPCLETTCPILQKIIPKMLDDGLRLTVDVMFPPPEQWPSSKKHLLGCMTGNGFQLVFDQSQQSTVANDKIYEMHGIGEIEEDDEIYQEQQ